MYSTTRLLRDLLADLVLDSSWLAPCFVVLKRLFYRIARAPGLAYSLTAPVSPDT